MGVGYGKMEVMIVFQAFGIEKKKNPFDVVEFDLICFKKYLKDV